MLCSVRHGQSGTVCRVSSWLQSVRRGGDWGGGGLRRTHPTRAPGQSRAAEKGGVAHARDVEGLRYVPMITPPAPSLTLPVQLHAFLLRATCAS